MSKNYAPVPQARGKTQPPVARLKALISQDSVQEQFKNALGRHSDLFVASLIDVFNGGLQNYEPGLVIQEALKAAVLKLPISKSLGFAYIVPYKGKPQFQIGYKGMIQLAMRSGQVKNINAGVIYEGEWQSTDKLRGIFDFSGNKTSDKEIGYFSYMELINGFEKTIYWTKEQVIAHATAKSPSWKIKTSAWHTDFAAMAIKTTLRALFGKYAPMSIDFSAAMTYDSESIEISGNDYESIEESATPDAAPAPASKSKKTASADPASEKQAAASEESDSVVDELQSYWMDTKKYGAVWQKLLDGDNPLLSDTAVETAIKNKNSVDCQHITRIFKENM